MKKIYSSFILFLFCLSANAQYTRWSSDLDGALTNIIYSPATNNLWQVGGTSKTFFGAASSLPNAIMTDTMNPYPINANSSFIIAFNTPSIYTNIVDNFIWIDFDHKFQTTAGHDGGAIEVSYDQVNWQNVLRDTFFANNAECGLSLMNCYQDTDTLFNGEPGFSGQSNGWLHTQIHWCWFLPVGPESIMSMPPDSMWLRFTFYSDGTSESLDGWMIDNMVLTGDNPSGVEELNSLPSLKVFPQPANDLLNLQLLNGHIPESYLIYDLAGRIVVADDVVDSSIDIRDLNSGSYVLVVMTKTGRYRASFIKN